MFPKNKWKKHQIIHFKGVFHYQIHSMTSWNFVHSPSWSAKVTKIVRSFWRWICGWFPCIMEGTVEKTTGCCCCCCCCCCCGCGCCCCCCCCCGGVGGGVGGGGGGVNLTPVKFNITTQTMMVRWAMVTPWSSQWVRVKSQQKKRSSHGLEAICVGRGVSNVSTNIWVFPKIGVITPKSWILIVFSFIFTKMGNIWFDKNGPSGYLHEDKTWRDVLGFTSTSRFFVFR